jgi:hypothetical protein
MTDHATIIRGAKFSFENIVGYGLLASVTATALFIAYRNLSRTKLQEMHMGEAKKLRSAGTRKGQNLDCHEVLIRTVAISYSHFLVSGLFLGIFPVLAAGLLSGLPGFVYKPCPLLI